MICGAVDPLTGAECDWGLHNTTYHSWSVQPPESAPGREQADPPALAASVVGAVRTENARLDDIRQRAEAAATSPERSHIWQDARDVPALLALVDELTAQRALARDAAVALEQENARLREELRDQWEANHVEHCSREWPHPEGTRCFWPLPAAVLGLGLQPETSEQ